MTLHLTDFFFHLNIINFDFIPMKVCFFFSFVKGMLCRTMPKINIKIIKT